MENTTDSASDDAQIVAPEVASANATEAILVDPAVVETSTVQPPAQLANQGGGHPKTPSAVVVPASPEALELVNGMARVDQLRQHPDNGTIYGDKDSIKDLVESVERVGIAEEMVVTRDGRVLSGNRRLRTAIKLGHAEVPARIFNSDDELEISNALLEFNTHRVKSGVQIGNEAIYRMKVEALRRARQSKANGAQKVENLPPATKGKTRDAVGAAMGLSGRTVAKAAKAAETVQKLRAEGLEDQAANIEAALDQSIDKGYNLAVGKEEVSEKPPCPVAGVTKETQNCVEVPPTQVLQLRAVPSGTLPGGKKLDSDAAVELIDRVMEFLREAGPNRLTAAEKSTWKKILQELQGILATLL